MKIKTRQSNALRSVAAIGILLGSLMGFSCSAMDFTLPSLAVTMWTNVLTASTNATSAPVLAENNDYHTFNVFALGNTNTNSGTVFLDRSLDTNNWTAFSTNIFTGTNGGTNEVTCIGKWSYFRARVGNFTNGGPYTINYLGGR